MIDRLRQSKITRTEFTFMVCYKIVNSMVFNGSGLSYILNHINKTLTCNKVKSYVLQNQREYTLDKWNWLLTVETHLHSDFWSLWNSFEK